MAVIKKYKGSTLPEVLVALAITSFCATLSVVIYINIQKSTLPFIRIKASELAERYMQDALLKKDYFDNSFTEEQYRIKKTAVKSQVFYDCINIKITVYDVGRKKLTELQATVYEN